MLDAIHVVKLSLQDYWEEFVLLFPLNILWCLVAALPLVPLSLLNSLGPIWVFAMALVLAIPLPIVSGALCFVANQISRGEAVGWRTFREGVQRYWIKSLVVALLNLIAGILIAINIQFYYAIVQGSWTRFALIAWLVVTVYWLLVQIFWFPMILELESERVLLALRNSLAVVIITPIFSLSLAVILALVIVLGILLVIPLFMALAPLALLMSNHATRSRLAFVQKKPYQPRADEG
jgi:hypothetical protein